MKNKSSPKVYIPILIYIHTLHPCLHYILKAKKSKPLQPKWHWRFYLWNTGMVTPPHPPTLKNIWRFFTKPVLPRKQALNLTVFFSKNVQFERSFWTLVLNVRVDMRNFFPPKRLFNILTFFYFFKTFSKLFKTFSKLFKFFSFLFFSLSVFTQFYRCLAALRAACYTCIWCRQSCMFVCLQGLGTKGTLHPLPTP